MAFRQYHTVETPETAVIAKAPEIVGVYTLSYFWNLF